MGEAKYATVKEAAEYLRLSPATVYRLYGGGVLRGFRVRGFDGEGKQAANRAAVRISWESVRELERNGA